MRAHCSIIVFNQQAIVRFHDAVNYYKAFWLRVEHVPETLLLQIGYFLMATEIEHKYLVDTTLWRQVTPESSFRIVQGYISRGKGRTVRVRIKGENGYLTVKGPSTGASREEFEYRIPLTDAEEMLRLFCPSRIEKVRYEVTVGGLRWEVDEFGGANEGLMIAEIELSSSDQSYEKPVWLKEEVTYDPRYSNASLSETPFSRW